MLIPVQLASVTKLVKGTLLEYVFCSQWAKGISGVEADFRRTSHRGCTYLRVFPIPYSYKAIFKTITRQSDPYINKRKILKKHEKIGNMQKQTFLVLFLLSIEIIPL